MNTFKKILIEIVSVVFAVLLALGLNHWREVKAEQNLADQALRNIVIEIRTNMRDIQQELKDYQENIDSLRSERRNLAINPDYKSKGYFDHSFLNNSAWLTAKNIGAIKDFDLDMLMSLSQVYKLQDLRENQGLNYYQSMFSVEFNNEQNTKARIQSNFYQQSTALALSKQLIQVYKDFISTHKAELVIVIHADSLVMNDDHVLKDSLVVD